MLLGEDNGRGIHTDVEISLNAVGKGVHVKRRTAIRVLLVLSEVASDREERRIDSETWKSGFLKGERRGENEHLEQAQMAAGTTFPPPGGRQWE